MVRVKITYTCIVEDFIQATTKIASTKTANQDSSETEYLHRMKPSISTSSNIVLDLISSAESCMNAVRTAKHTSVFATFSMEWLVVLLDTLCLSLSFACLPCLSLANRFNPLLDAPWEEVFLCVALSVGWVLIALDVLVGGGTSKKSSECASDFTFAAAAM